MGTTWLGSWNGFHEGAWRHPKRKKDLTGEWKYLGGDRFVICLDKIDSVTGQNKVLTVYGDAPEWDKWKLVREKEVEE